MRGSPLLRFILMVFALAATGIGLLRVTAARSPGGLEIEAPAPANPALKGVPYRLVLSAPADSVEINSILMPAARSPVSGTLQLDPNNPGVVLKVRWENPAATGEHRFAKLTLEAPGQETVTHVFDATGDIDDFLELPAATHR